MLLIYILIKLIEIICMILMNNFQEDFMDFFFEFYIFFFIVISYFIKLSINAELNLILKGLFLEKNYSTQYFQSLINMLNKSFLSINLSFSTLSVNLSFLNLLRRIGIKESEIEFLNDFKSNDLYEEFNMKKFHTNHSKEKEIYFGDDLNIKNRFKRKNSDFKKINNGLNKFDKNTNIDRAGTHGLFLNISQAVLDKDQSNGNLNITKNNLKNNSTLLNSKFDKRSGAVLSKSTLTKNKTFPSYNDDYYLYNFDTLKKNRKEIFSSKLDFLFTQVFNEFEEQNYEIFYNKEENDPLKKNDTNKINEEIHFIQNNNEMISEIKKYKDSRENVMENILGNHPNINKINNYNNTLTRISDKSPISSLNEKKNIRSLSDSLKEIFFKAKSIDISENFTYKGTYIYQGKNCNVDNIVNNHIILELYYRKIIFYQGEIIEFYFNDVTTLLSKVQREKEQNKIRSLILAKISHEFKTPLITIIYILKDYIKKKKDLSKLDKFDTYEKYNKLKKIENKNDQINNYNYNITIDKIDTQKFSIDHLNDIDINNLIIKNNRNLSNFLKESNKDINKKKRFFKLNNINLDDSSFESNKLDNEKIYFTRKSNLTDKTQISDKNFCNDNYLYNTIDLSDYMLSLINDIVDFSAIDNSLNLKYQFDHFNLIKLLNFCFRILKIFIDCRGLNNFITPILSIDDNVPKNFYSDETRIKQVILNLISNSIKFTRRGHIKISARSIDDLKNIEISIEDTGVGITIKDQKNLFSDFGKLHNSDSEKLNKIGSGLGLSICKKIIENLGNGIDVFSIPNQETKFSFFLNNKISKENSILNKTFNIINDDNSSYEQNIDLNKDHNKTISNIISHKNNNDNNIVEFDETQAIDFSVNLRRKNCNSSISYKGQTSREIKNTIVLSLNKKNIEEVNPCKMIKNNSNEIKNYSLSENNYLLKNTKLSYLSDQESSNSSIANSENTVLESANINHDIDLIKIFDEINYIKSKSERDNYNESLNQNKNSIFPFMEVENFNKPLIKYLKNKNKQLILVADDNEIIRNSIKKLIKTLYKSKDIKTITVSDGIEILYLVMINQIMYNNIKMIISDEQMIFLNGTDVNRILKIMEKDNKINSIPFVYCSSNREDTDYLKKNDINFSLNKPPNKKEIQNLFEILNII